MVQGRNQVTTRPSRRGAIWVGGVTLFAVGVIATVYWSTVGSRAAQPSLRSVTCHWQGHRVVVSGVAFNPNSTAQEVVISNIRVRFDRGPMMKLVNSFGPRRLEGLSPHTSAAWATSARPQGSGWNPGDKVTACRADAHNWVRGD